VAEAEEPEASQRLSTIPLFALLDPEERGELAERTETVTFPAGHLIFSVGDPGDRLYAVRTGVVEIFVTNDTGSRIVLDTARAGDYFGEISLLDEGPRTASALVIEDLEATVVDRGHLEEFFRANPTAAMDLLSALGRRLRETNKLLRSAVSRNVNVEEQDKRTRVMRIADWISEFSGSLEFLFIHCGLFFLWIIVNVAPLDKTAFGGWDAYPFGLLTMSVSLEAIILSVFVLLSQNRQVARDRVRNDVEYQVNVRAELGIAALHKKVDELHESLFARLDRIERGVPSGGSRRP
jgi:uncharacterized membrane protein